MNWDKLFEIQGGLDFHITKEKGLQGQDLLPQKILALQVELGELAQEVQDAWKFWKLGFKRNGKKVLEEYVDCLHFILSIGLDLKLTDIDILTRNRLISSNVTEVLSDLIMGVSTLKYEEADKKHNYGSVLHGFNHLGELLGFTAEQIEAAYLEKNKINHDRQVNGY
ncbi:dUTP diphosphatase [Sediminibacillus massiliensis]|uniref:dUTP diphosphatase n=1 Tax=Sediminibacillus massiliensis TaxID=1926277 RepID=UPI0009886B72|nr:dUTP diphosphatase [Sediminibacillus massiliensis]